MQPYNAGTRWPRALRDILLTTPAVLGTMNHPALQLDPGRPSTHEVLFPLDDRQLAALAEVAPREDARRALISIHGGLVDALKSAAHEAGASIAVREWILLEDEALASDFIAQLDLGDCRELRSRVAATLTSEVEHGVPLGDAYCATLPPDLRHRLGEHYTPWPVVRRIADEVQRDDVVADPSCGDGRFLVELLRRGHEPASLWGGDLNPLAVAMARWSVWTASHRPKSVPATCVSWTDFLIGGIAGGLVGWAPQIPGCASPPNHFVGNPPWVLWRNLGPSYRDAIARVYGATPLNQAKGWGARVSAGQTNLAYLFLHEAAERVGTRGRISFVMPRSLLKSPVGASVVRSGKTTSGRRFRYDRILDYRQTAVFEQVRSETIVALLRADEEQQFPVPWEMIGDLQKPGQESPSWPSDAEDPTSSWTAGGEYPPLALRPGVRRSTLVARGGVNTGGGNGVFHVDIVASEDRLVTVRNRPSRGSPSRVLEAQVEAHHLHPLLRGKDINRWHVRQDASILLTHRPDDPRKPIAEERLAAESPQLLAYLRYFHDELASRKELARWGGAWYSLFRIGFYTVGCWRVVWPCSSGHKLRAAVLAAEDPTIPDQSVVLVPFESSQPAHFLCAVLNSSIIREACAAGAGFDASPNLVKRLALPEWDPTNELHTAISEMAARAHAGVDASQPAVDAMVEELYAQPAATKR